MNKQLKIALLLTAVDKMSSVIGKAFGMSEESMSKFKAATKYFAEGSALMGAGEKLASTLKPAINAFADAEEASNDLKASMLDSNGILNQNLFNRIDKMTQQLSNKYVGTKASYLDMVRVLKNNRIDEKDVLDGIGEATAQLADYFKMLPASVGEFFSHMKNDMGVQVKDMGNLADMIARIHGAGVGKTGEEATNEMTEFFGKASLGAANLGVQGLKATKELGALGALFMSRGLSGATVGTNFRRIFDGMRDADKLGKATAMAKQLGVQLQLFDKKGHFLGMDNFIQQIGKLEKLKPQQISGILKAFGGKQGLSTDFMEYLAQHGLEGFSEFNKKIEEQAKLTKKLSVIMSGLNYVHRVINAIWQNAKVNFGASMGPALHLFAHLIEKVVSKIGNLVSLHPRIMKFISAIIAFTSAALMIAGVIKIFQGLMFVIKGVWALFMANPILIAIAAIIAVAALVYTYWDKIKAFFVKLWNGVKKVFATTWNWIKNLFLNYTPEGLIIKHWDKIKAFFKKLWDWVKWIFKPAWDFIKRLLLTCTGASLVIKYWKPISGFFKGLWNGVKNIFNVVLEIGKFLFLNFTPLGLIIKYWEPLTKFFSSLWKGIKDSFMSAINWIVDKFKWLNDNILKPLGKAFWAGPPSQSWAAGIGGNTSLPQPAPARLGTSISNAPVINLYGSATQKDANMIQASIDRANQRVLDRILYNKQRGALY